MANEVVLDVNTINVPENLMDMYSIKGYNTVITGGASGLGEALSIGFAMFGSNIIILDMNEEGMQRVAKRVEAFGVRCEYHKVDVTNYELVEATAKEVEKSFGKIDVLLNSAGMNIRKPALELTSAEYQKVVGVDLTGTFNCCKAFGEIMAKHKKGSIVNFASTNAYTAIKGNVAYACAKAGVVQMTKVLANEWAELGIRVNAISPAHHKTPLIAGLVGNKEWYDGIVSHIPMDRFAEAYEIIGPVLYLASEMSSFTTGISLLSDGGWVTV